MDQNKIIMLEKCDQYSEGKYTGLFHKAIKAKEADILFKQKKYRDIVANKDYLRLFFKQYGAASTGLLLARALRSML